MAEVPDAGGGPAASVAVRAAAAAQVFVDDPSHPVVGPDDRHHLTRVLRLAPGADVVAADGAGSWVRCRLVGGERSATGDGAGTLLEPVGPVVSEPRPRPALTVAFAVPKGDRPEWIVQKLTELGVDRIVPLRTRRSVVRWEGDRAVRAVERLRRVAREAAAQCRRVWLPEVLPVLGLAELVGAAGGPPGTGTDGEAAGPVALAHPGGPPPAADLAVVAVGPEGGWAPEELELGPGTVGLGPYVLRAETAAVAAGVLLAGLRAGTVEAAGRSAGPAWETDG